MSELTKFRFEQFHHITIGTLPPQLQPLFAPVPYSALPSKETDLRVIVALDLPSMREQIHAIAADHLLVADGYVYLLYPKMSSKHYAGIPRDDIFPYLQLNQATGEVGDTGLKFSRMRSFNADFTLVDLRWLAHAPRPKAAASQRNADYSTRVPDLQARLAHSAPAQVSAFAALTPYMQRDWARYVYSAKRPVTQNSHFEQLVLVLAAGFRTLAEYKAAL